MIASVRWPLTLASVLTLAACAPAQNQKDMAKGMDGHRADLPAVRTTGAAVSCIPISTISESRVQDDWTIDFRSGVRQWYRVTLPQRCNSLGFYKTFRYRTSLSELCNTDIIEVIETGPSGGMRGACGLAPFQPVELVRK